MKFLFLYPPSTDPTAPPLCLARIKGMTNELFQKKFRFDFLDENYGFTKYVIDLVLSERIKISASLPKDLLKSLAILKIKNLFLDIKKYSFAYNSILKAFQAFSYPFYPSYIGYATSRLSFDIRDSSQIKMALQSPKLNPYLEYFSYRLKDISDTDILGISVIYSSQLLASLTIARLVKKVKKDILILLGGPYASSIRKGLLKNFPEIDAIIPGDAEAFLETLRDKIKKRKDVLSLANEYVKNGDYFSPPKYPVDYSWADLSKYLLPEPVLSLDITRGCYYGKCVFCSYGHYGAPYRKMKIKDILSTIKRIRNDLKVKRLFFSVDAVDLPFLEELSKRLIKEAIDITYCIDARLESKFKDKEFVQMLFDSGCRAISFGMESASQKTLNSMNKGIKADNFSDIFKNLNDAGIHVQVHLIHGFPGEKKEELQRTMKFLESHREKIVTAGASRFTLLVGSAMEKEMERYGIHKAILSGDLALDYEHEVYMDQRYPDFNTFKEYIFSLFPTVGRLTGSTTDYLIYASYYSPEDMIKLLR